MVTRGIFSTAALSLCFGLWGAVRADAATQDADGGDGPPPRGGKGTIQIKTTPEKAMAYLGGVKLGNTPVDTAFESGRHTLTILLNGEELVRERVNVWPNKVTTVEKKLLMPYGNLTLTTNPLNCNCRVTIDGEDVGSTKGGVLTINRIEAGTRVVKVFYGKRAKEVNIDIQPEQTVDLAVDFTGT
jgi:hypothetical protein